MLIIVPTPIGNLKDITLRALEVLQTVDGIICEDSRRSSILLNHYQIKKPLLVLNDFNEEKTVSLLTRKLKEGQNLALVSDAGTPLISDPGYKLVKKCIKENIAVDSLPGPSSVTTALTLSGLPPDKFFFLGYLPEKQGHRKTLLEKLKIISTKINITYIVFVSPHKILKTLGDMGGVLGNIEITLTMELSKIHQQVRSKTILSWQDELSKNAPKGEIVLLFKLQP